MQTRRQQSPSDGESELRYIPEGVTLLDHMPDAPHEDLGRVGFTSRTAPLADRGLQLWAGIRGADAVVGVYRSKCDDAGAGNRHADGRAVRVADAAARNELRRRSYAEQVGALVRRMVLLLVIQAAVYSIIGLFCAGATRFQEATGETPQEALPAQGIGLALVYSWPLVLLILVRILRGPTLLKTTALAIIAVTAGRGLMLRAAHVLAAWAVGNGLGAGSLWLLFDPVDWAFIIIGVRMGLRAWRLADDARLLLPRESLAALRPHLAWGRVWLGLTGVYVLGVLGVTGFYRYRADTHLLQPGVDPKREHQALLALNQGVNYVEKGDLEAGERSLQSALRLWEELTKGHSAPAVYRINLATTLFDLGWLREKQDRFVEAEKYYVRALAAGEHLVDDPQASGEFRRIMNEARRGCELVRSQQKGEALDEQDRTACRKFEEGEIKEQQGDDEAAERCYEQAIAAWEEILPQATAPDYRKSAVVRLASAYLTLADLHERQGKTREAEKALRQSIAHGEKAVNQAPDRALAKHNLQAARQDLVNLRERSHTEKIDQLLAADHVAEALDLCRKGVEEMEEQRRSGQDRDLATRRLATRLDRLGWLLAHAPEGRGGDSKKAVAHARRAVDLTPDAADFRYTLAAAQYRNGDWRDSLNSLELMKAGDNRVDARHWYLISLNRSKLNQKVEAQEAFRKGNEWAGETERKAATDLRLRFQLDSIRPALERLRREAEELIQGKDPASRGVG
jgi:tetratricopeptide (TPR) repeat protein